MLIDLFLVDIIWDDKQDSFSLSDKEELTGISEYYEADIEEDEDLGVLIILFFLGGKDIDEPYTDLAGILTLLQFSDYFEIELEKGGSEY